MSGFSFLRLLAVAAAAVAASMIRTTDATSEAAAAEPAQDDPVDLERDRKARAGGFQSGGDQEGGEPAKQAALLSEVDEVPKSKINPAVRTWQQPRGTVHILLRMYTKERASLDTKPNRTKTKQRASSGGVFLFGGLANVPVRLALISFLALMLDSYNIPGTHILTLIPPSRVLSLPLSTLS